MRHAFEIRIRFCSNGPSLAAQIEAREVRIDRMRCWANGSLRTLEVRIRRGLRRTGRLIRTQNCGADHPAKKRELHRKNQIQHGDYNGQDTAANQ